MKTSFITDSVVNIGASDKKCDLFEGQYPLENGMAYNSYLILDEKTALLDCVDCLVKDEFLENLYGTLGERALDYIIIQHLEPDHSGCLDAVLAAYPDAKIVLSKKAESMLESFCYGSDGRDITAVTDGDTLCLGKKTLHFVTAPMVHWPDVIVTYEESEKILFSADAFGKFGALDCGGEWLPEARRYYINIVGKYGAPVQTLLKKAGGLDIRTICPLHGPVLTENLGYYIGLYDTWSKYEAEENGVFIAFASLHGNTGKAAEYLKRKLDEAGVKNEICNLSRCDVSYAVANAFRYKCLVLAASSYDAGLMPKAEELLCHLKAKSFQNRTVGLIENGAWAPSAAKKMKEAFTEMKSISLIEPFVTVRVRMTENTSEQIDELCKKIAESL